MFKKLEKLEKIEKVGRFLVVPDPRAAAAANSRAVKNERWRPQRRDSDGRVLIMISMSGHGHDSFGQLMNAVSKRTDRYI